MVELQGNIVFLYFSLFTPCILLSLYYIFTNMMNNLNNNLFFIGAGVRCERAIRSESDYHLLRYKVVLRGPAGASWLAR